MTNQPMTKGQYRQIIKEGLERLTNKIEGGYSKKTITEKLDYLGHGVSPSFLTKFSKGNPVSEEYLKKAGDGFLKILELEKGLVYNKETSQLERTSDPEWKPHIVGEELVPGEKVDEEAFKYYEEGRLLPSEKVAFMESAKHEVIEVGVRLRAFLEYMTRGADRNFKRPIETLLERGIDVKCYILDPDAQIVHLYFDDLAKEIPKEAQSESVIRDVIRGLTNLSQEFVKAGHPGTLEVYTYAHVPQAHFFVVDKDFPNGKMMTSHYIFGLARGKCPVVKFTKRGKPQLFEKYKEGLEIIMRRAKQIAP